MSKFPSNRRAGENHSQKPSVILSMGKVGSNTMRAAMLRGCGQPHVLSVHSLSVHFGVDMVPRVGKSAHGAVVSKETVDFLRHYKDPNNEPIYITSMVRDPLSRNLSHLFFSPHFFGLQKDSSLQEYKKYFMDEFPHRWSGEFFQREFGYYLGIDVFAAKNGLYANTIIEDNSHASKFRILLLRLEDVSEKWHKGLSKLYFGKEEMVRPVRFHKIRGDRPKYNKFKDEVKFPKSFVDYVYDEACSWTDKFYSQDEITKMKKKWYA